MAGNYPDVPGPRMAYDRDGSVGFTTSGNKSGTISPISAGDLELLNNEVNSGPTVSSGGPFSHTTSYGLIFPELRDVVGFLHQVPAGVTEVETSVDTTTGLDGTWVQEFASYSGFSMDPPSYRENIDSVSWDGIKAIRMTHAFGGDESVRGLHLYGNITAGETEDRLRLWHPTLDQPLDDPTETPDGAYFDWGNAPQNSSQDRTFRIKNNSSILDANDITVSLDSLTPAAVPDVHTLSDDGSSFSSTVSITLLVADDISDVLTLRRTTPSNATMGLYVIRILADADSWS